jgi:hypothetical protein
MGLITVEDFEDAIGRTLDADEVATVEYGIALVSRYVRSYTGVSFVFTEDDVLRCKSDYYGRVELNEPVESVASVEHHDGGTVWGWHWDGLGEIYNLPPMTVVDVTYSHGYDEVPADIHDVAVEAVRRYLVDPELQEVSARKVGDVQEQYAVDTSLAGSLFNDIDRFILDGYRGTMTTLRIGFAQPDPKPWPQSTDTALFE